MTADLFAVVSSDRELASALLRRASEFGLDAVAAALQKNLTTSKRLNPFLVFILAEILGLRIELRESENAAAMLARLSPRKTKQTTRATTPRPFELPIDLRFIRARHGGFARAAILSPEARSASARVAACRKHASMSGADRKAHASMMAKARWKQMRANPAP